MEEIMLKHGDHRFTLGKDEDSTYFTIGSSINGTYGKIKVDPQSFYELSEVILSDTKTQELLRGAQRPYPNEIKFQPIFQKDNLEAFNSETPSWAIVFDGIEFILMPVAIIREISICIQDIVLAS